MEPRRGGGYLGSDDEAKAVRLFEGFDVRFLGAVPDRQPGGGGGLVVVVCWFWCWWDVGVGREGW